VGVPRGRFGPKLEAATAALTVRIDESYALQVLAA